jgi:hypothetical protein
MLSPERVVYRGWKTRDAAPAPRAPPRVQRSASQAIDDLVAQLAGAHAVIGPVEPNDDGPPELPWKLTVRAADRGGPFDFKIKARTVRDGNRLRRELIRRLAHG